MLDNPDRRATEPDDAFNGDAARRCLKGAARNGAIGIGRFIEVVGHCQVPCDGAS